MSAQSSAPISVRAEPNQPDASRLNGDVGLTSDERSAYLHFHRERNRHLSHLSRVEQVVTLPMPCRVDDDQSASSPSRVAMDSLVRWYGRRVSELRDGAPVRVLDIGCGSGYVRGLLAEAGLRGEYIGLDHAEHPKFGACSSAAFAPRLILGDVHALRPSDVGAVDLLISMTSLEHFEHDRMALERARQTLGPGAGELHIVPAEKGLDLWGPHGWRQYSPRCVRQLSPEAEIYRVGGAVSAMVHEAMVVRTRGREGRQTHPRLYRRLRRWSHELDRWTHNRPASLYASVIWPAGRQG